MILSRLALSTLLLLATIIPSTLNPSTQVSANSLAAESIAVAQIKSVVDVNDAFDHKGVTGGDGQMSIEFLSSTGKHNQIREVKTVDSSTELKGIRGFIHQQSSTGGSNPKGFFDDHRHSSTGFSGQTGVRHHELERHIISSSGLHNEIEKDHSSTGSGNGYRNGIEWNSSSGQHNEIESDNSSTGSQNAIKLDSIFSKIKNLFSKKKSESSPVNQGAVTIYDWCNGKPDQDCAPQIASNCGLPASYVLWLMQNDPRTLQSTCF
jgi:hypothetical protein